MVKHSIEVLVYGGWIKVESAFKNCYGGLEMFINVEKLQNLWNGCPILRIEVH